MVTYICHSDTTAFYHRVHIVKNSTLNTSSDVHAGAPLHIRFYMRAHIFMIKEFADVLIVDITTGQNHFFAEIVPHTLYLLYSKILVNGIKLSDRHVSFVSECKNPGIHLWMPANAFHLWKTRYFQVWILKYNYSNLEDKKHLETNTFQIWMSNYVLIVEDKKHLHLDENKYIPNLDVKLCSDCGKQETPTFG